MVITAELSLYPLIEDYEVLIIKFIKVLKIQEDVKVLTNAQSTYIIGASEQVFSAINEGLKVLDPTTCSLVVKIVNKKLAVENGFLNF